jgi:tRNA dimethylallyltransferase
MRSSLSGLAVVITGPTGVGKSELAADVAERIGGEVISADSRQVYRGMDAGTAKPSAALRARVPHHGLDLLEPDESYSAGRFARDAWSWIAGIRERGRVPLIVGGTGFFLRALLAPLGPEPALDSARLASLRRYLDGRGPDELLRWLTRLDPRRARQLSEEGGRQRVARSLEVALLSGRPHSWWHGRRPETEPLAASVFCLELPRPDLYQRLDARFERMMAEGLLEEVRRLLARYPADAPGLEAVGYAELASHLRGERTLEASIHAAKRNTRRYARRQLTWFRHQLPAGAIRLDAARPAAELAGEIETHWAVQGAPLAERRLPP